MEVTSEQVVTQASYATTGPASVSLYVVSFVSGGVLVAVLAAIALVCCITCRYFYRRGDVSIRPNHMTGLVVQNSLRELPVQAEEVEGQRVRYVAHWNCLVEKGTDELSQGTSVSHTTPSYSDYSCHFCPSQPTQPQHTSQPQHASPPLQAVIDPLSTCRRSFRSNPDDVINSHPHMACTMTKSHSCTDALNKSYGLATFVNTVAIAMSTPSLASSHTPIQANRTPSPALSGRVAILRRFFGLRGSIRSTVSDQSSIEPVVMYTHYETPV